MTQPIPNGGNVLRPPLFTDEGPQYAQQAFAHNAPFSQGAPYRTRLNDGEEHAFRIWLQRYGNHENLQEFHPDNPSSDYDMRGWWKENAGAPPGDFFNDKYKTPYDPTFSNQSSYATQNCPFMWKDDATLIDIRDGSTVFFNPSHYASEQGQPMQTDPFAPPDMPAPVRRQQGGPVGLQNGGSVDDTIIGDRDPQFKNLPGEEKHYPARDPAIFGPGDTGDPFLPGRKLGDPVVQPTGYGPSMAIRHADGQLTPVGQNAQVSLQPGEGLVLVTQKGIIDNGKRAGRNGAMVTVATKSR